MWAALRNSASPGEKQRDDQRERPDYEPDQEIKPEGTTLVAGDSSREVGGKNKNQEHAQCAVDRVMWSQL
jgi:hypothetical protein